ncbi:MAG TPA: DUF4381 domain-containing protein [Thiothrix sp.]|nr:DUF4381 domain-containing protein [Thiothrix sp.]
MTTPITNSSQAHSHSAANAASNATNALNALPEIQLPADNKIYDAPSIWPLAAGWWVVIVLLLIALGFTGYKGYRYRQMKRQQHALLSILETFDNNLQRDKNSAAVAQMNQLLRRLALMHFPRQHVASLTGKQWLAFLDKTGNTNAFSKGAGRILAEGPYVAQLPDTLDHKGLVEAIKQWLMQINNKYYQQHFIGSKRGKQWK